MDPSMENIFYYAGSLINKNIKHHLERKKLKIINKMVHIMLEDQIKQAKQNRMNTIKEKKKEKEIISKKQTLSIGDIVYTNMGKGVIREIREDNIIVLVMDITLHNHSIGYYHIDSISLEDKTKTNIINNTSLLTNLTRKIYNVKKYILGF